MDALDRRIVNELQGGFPLGERPYAEVAARLGTGEGELMRRIDALLADGTLSRFGPMYHAERLGGGLTLAAMQVPPDDFERVVAIVNAFPEVAHNYAREHALNMWFVGSAEPSESVGAAFARIEKLTGHAVYRFPKEREFFVELKLSV